MLESAQNEHPDTTTRVPRSNSSTQLWVIGLHGSTMNEMSLNGEWKAIDATKAPEDFNAIDYDDAHWSPIEIPSHWATQEGFATTTQALRFRKNFTFDAAPNARSWLQFGGVFTHADVWLNNTYVGEIEGYFARHAFDISEIVRDKSQHVLAIEVSSPSFDVPWATPGGLWQPISIKQTKNVHIARLKVLCSEASEDRAVLDISAELDTIAATEVEIRTRVTPALNTSHTGADDQTFKTLAAGKNRIQWRVNIDQPDLWWPWNLGNQPLFDVCVDVSERSDAKEISDSTTVRTGLRQISFDNGFTYVNGTRVFLQSIESGNDGTLPLQTDHEYFSELIGKRKQHGANMLVRSQWIEPQSFYDAADELGMLVWQGVPYSASTAPTLKHARQMVEALGSHPSISLWLRPMKRIRDWRPMPDALKRTLERSDSSRVNIEHPAGWDLHRLSPRDVYEITPHWVKRSRFFYFTSDPREAAAHVEALRLLRFKPLGGYLAPLALPELLDGACDEVRLVALPLEGLETDSEAKVEIFLINETQNPISDAIITATVPAYAVAEGRVSGHDATWKWSGGAQSDSVDYVGTMAFLIPNDPALTSLDVTLKLDTGEISSRTAQLSIRSRPHNMRG